MSLNQSIMLPLTQPDRLRGRITLFCLLALMLVFAPLGGCTPGGLFAPQIPVSANPLQVLSDGAAKEKVAHDANAAGSKTEAERIYQDTATYYMTAAKQYSGQSIGLQANMAAARIEADNLNQLQQSYTTLRKAAHDYPVGSLGNSPLPNDLQQQYVAVEDRLDKENRKSPFYTAMDVLMKIAHGNAPLALFGVAVIVTLLTWPLRRMVLVQANEMKRFQPELKKIQEKYKDEQMLLMEKTQEFNKKHGINMMSGCLPALAQWPITLLMLQVVGKYQFSFANSHFLWVNPAFGAISQHWPAPLTGAIAPSLAETDTLLLATYVASMYFQMRFTPAATADPQAAETQKQMATIMPIFFFFIMYNAGWASAFILYWIFSNLLTLGQQWIINRQLPKIEPLVLDANGDPVNVPGASSATGALAPNARLISPKNARKK